MRPVFCAPVHPHAMSGCPVHSSNERGPSDESVGTVRWDLVFLTLAVGMLALILVVAWKLP